jgi:putative tryptophan/tyrosine transport system substrate-binding protein
MRRSFLPLFSIFITLALVCVRASGDETLTTFYVVDSGSEIHQKLQRELRNEIARRQVDNVKFVTEDELRELYHKSDKLTCRLLLPVGTETTKTIIDLSIDAPVLSIALPSINYDSLRQMRSKSTPPFSAIFLDQPIDRRINLLHELLPAAKRISVLLGPSTIDHKDELELALSRQNYTADIGYYDGEDNLIGVLDSLLENSDAMLSIADPAIFNTENARNILLTAYHWRIPLIGLSPAYVRAGALAAVYTSSSQLVTQVAETIESHTSCSSIKQIQSQYPKYFDVIINYQVAEAIGVVVDSQDRLRNKLGPVHTKVKPE